MDRKLQGTVQYISIYFYAKCNIYTSYKFYRKDIESLCDKFLVLPSYNPKSFKWFHTLPMLPLTPFERLR